MGRVFLIERDGPVFRCAACNTEIAQIYYLLDDWLLDLGLHEFADAYNVMIGEEMVPYGNNLYNGYEVNCVNCSALLGWKELDEEPNGEVDEKVDSDGQLDEEVHKETNSDEKPDEEVDEEQVYPLFRFMHERVVPPPANTPPQFQNLLPAENPPQLQNPQPAGNPPPQPENLPEVEP